MVDGAFCVWTTKDVPTATCGALLMSYVGADTEIGSIGSRLIEIERSPLNHAYPALPITIARTTGIMFVFIFLVSLFSLYLLNGIHIFDRTTILHRVT